MGWFNHKEKKLKNENIWIKCSACNKPVLKDEFEKNDKVCPKCEFHERLNAQERIDLLFDKDTFLQEDSSVSPNDPLKFVDAKSSYVDRISSAKNITGLNESVITGAGKINGIEVAAAIMDFRFLGGSLGSGTGEKIYRIAMKALNSKIPLLIVSASGGARMQEGIFSLMQMAKTCAAISMLNEKNIPYISILTDPTTGGVSASFAMVGDINIAEKGALIAFAGRRVIENTIKQKLPDEFQTAEYLLEHGFVDKVVSRSEMKKTISGILSFYNRQTAGGGK
ncbi:MAG: acetyl-CoA carboxylase, carboxyltransferase subunit beta [Chitinispirillales bacterium]|nr:acetyl-CoA carboxylase, carboxyltransferase subunit beta [Chitinispirillales bacterium]